MKELHEITTLIGKPSNPTYAVEEDENKTFIVTQKHLGKYFPLDNFWEDPEALYTTKDFLNKNQEYVLQPNDLILYSVGAYIGKANVYDAEIPAIIGSFLTIIRTTEECNPYYLACYLNSPIGTQLTKRYQKGLAQQYIYPVDIKNFPIPLIEKTKQNEIADLIIEARELMKASKALVKKAIMTVEKELS